MEAVDPKTDCEGVEDCENIDPLGAGFEKTLGAGCDGV